MDWHDLEGFLARLEKGGTALNYATLSGQGSLRGAAMGFKDRPPKPEKTERMKAHLEADLEVGVFGFSTGLEYLPSGFAAAARGDVYATHMRDEGDRPIEAVTEAIEAARASGVSLQISLLKTASPVAVQTLAPAEAPISLSFRSLQPGEAILAKSKADAAVKRVVLTLGDQIRALDPAVVYDLSAEGCAGDDSLRKRARG